MSGLQAWGCENRGSIPGKGRGVSSFLHRVRTSSGTHRLPYAVEYGERGVTLTIHLHELFLNCVMRELGLCLIKYRNNFPFSFSCLLFISVASSCVFSLLQVSKRALLGAILPAHGNVQPCLVPFDLPVVTFSLAWCHLTVHGNVSLA